MSDGKDTYTCDESSFSIRKNSGKAEKWKIFADLPKQCWCEPENKYEPYHCSEDGGQCSCKNGNVFYGAKFALGNATKMSNFLDASNQPLTVVAAN